MQSGGRFIADVSKSPEYMFLSEYSFHGQIIEMIKSFQNTSTLKMSEVLIRLIGIYQDLKYFIYAIISAVFLLMFVCGFLSRLSIASNLEYLAQVEICYTV